MRGEEARSRREAKKRRRRGERRRREGSPRIDCGAGNHRLNTDRMKEWEGEGRRGGGGGIEGGVKHCKAVSQSHVSQSHEPGWVGERMVRHPGNIYKHTVDMAS